MKNSSFSRLCEIKDFTRVKPRGFTLIQIEADLKPAGLRFVKPLVSQEI